MPRIRLFLPAFVLAAAPALSDPVELRLTAGQTLRGEIVRVDDQALDLRIDDAAASIVSIQVGDLEPISRVLVYRHWKDRLPASSGRERLRLATFCLRFGLLLEAQSEFRAAAELDPALAEDARRGIADARAKMADSMAAEGIARLEAGDHERALELFVRTLDGYPDTAAAERVRPLVDATRERVEAAARAAARPAPAAGAAPPEPPRPTEWERAIARLAPILDQAEAAFREGIEWEGRSQPARAVRSFVESEERFEAAGKGVDDLASAAARKRIDPGTDGLATLDRVRKRLREGSLQLYLALAHYYAGTRQLHQARAYVNRALAIDPQHAGANDLRQTITDEILRGGR